MSLTALECIRHWHLADVARSDLMDVQHGLTRDILWNHWTTQAHNAQRVLSALFHPANDAAFVPAPEAA